MQRWCIKDERVVVLLLLNGFVVQDLVGVTDGTNWMYTDLPIEVNCQYLLPDGHVIRSVGTELKLVGE